MAFGPKSLALGQSTRVMGIINTSPDSFAGDALDADGAVKRGLQMVAQGAEFLDVGGQSTRPGSQPIDPELEISLTAPIIARLAEQVEVPISIDTYKPAVAREALRAGAGLVNDISGLSWGTKMAAVCAEFAVPLVIMHIQGTPADMQKSPHYDDVVGDIISYFESQVALALKEGLRQDQIILDPGIGFGKKLEHNLEIIRRLAEFKGLGFPVMIGPSRKSFIGAVLDSPVDQRLEGTAAVVALATASGVDIVRVHDVEAMSRVVKMTEAVVAGAASTAQSGLTADHRAPVTDSPPDRIQLKGMTFYCHHGVNEAERELGQKIVVDVELSLDLYRVGTTDDKKGIVDYSKVYALVKEIATTERVNLLETIAHRIAEGILEHFPVRVVTVGVTKPQPPVDGLVDSATIIVHRRREGQ
jgi:dihydropteroate synthase